MNLDDIFESQDSIAVELHSSLNECMNEYGYIIQHALITRIWPNEHVKQSMNEMQASKRMKEAMPHKAEAVRIQAVKDAEARAERAHLHGIGLSRERREIARGMQSVMSSVLGDESYVKSSCTVSPKGVMDLLLLTQYFDVLTDLNGQRKRPNGAGETEERGEPPKSLFLTHMPATVSQLSATARQVFGDASCDPVKVENLLDL